MKKGLIWFWMLQKRLYKKPSFLCILLLIPLLVTLFQLSSREKAGILTVALASENPKDVFAAEFMQQLEEDASVIAFVETTPERAVTLVETGKADAAWIFPDDLYGCIQAYASGEMGSFIRVVERERTVALRLAGEKLSGRIYAHTAESLYLQFVRRYAPETGNLADDVLLSYWEKTPVTGELFTFSDIYGNPQQTTANYLTAPIRGMLAVVVLLAAVATAMYYQKDADRGIFCLLPKRYHFLAELGYQMISVGNLMAAVLAALFLSGLAASFGRELFLFVFYGIGCCLFAMVLRMLIGGRRSMAVVLPVLISVMLVVCPMFFDFAALRFLQYQLPPTYYIQGAYHQNTALCLVLYDGILLGISIGLGAVRSKFPSALAFCRK